MIPYSDDTPTRVFPIVTVILIALNILVFFSGFGQAGPQELLNNYGLIPAKLTSSPIAAYPTLFTSMFLHAGLMHLGGNMLYLWIFGDNIEDVLGRSRFIIFYFLCGVLAAAGHIATDLHSPIPMVGASGAISGILGAYVVLFPKARVKTLIFLGFFMTLARIPAWILLGIWILMQVGNSMAMSVEGGGVAWFAHIGGFAVGALLILPFKKMAA
jgi:membrane associated rhomboid family serine protease